MKWKTTVIHKAQREVDPQKTHNTKHMQKGGLSHTKNSRPLKTVFTK